MLQEATPRTQYAAWAVSDRWEEMVTYILQNCFREPHPCAPIEYGQLIERELEWLQPSASEIACFESNLEELAQEGTLIEQGDVRKLSRFFCPAHLTQGKELPHSAYELFRTFCQHRCHPDSLAALPPRTDGPHWLDLTQLQVNPHFVDLFQDFLQLTQGTCEIAVKPHLDQHLRYQTWLTTPVPGNLVQSMFLTQPPCKVLGL